LNFVLPENTQVQISWEKTAIIQKIHLVSALFLQAEQLCGSLLQSPKYKNQSSKEVTQIEAPPTDRPLLRDAPVSSRLTAQPG